MKILLTEKQDAMLRGMFDLVNEDYLKGAPGMLAGQFFDAKEGPGFFEVGYLTGERATIMLREMGVEEPELTDLQATVYSDVE